MRGSVIAGVVVPGCIAGALAVAALTLAVALLAVKLLWAWTVPDLFPGAVAQGLIAREISWLAALKVALIVSLITGASRGGAGERN